MLTLVMESVSLPVLLKIRLWAGLALPTNCGAKGMESVDRVATAVVPVPESETGVGVGPLPVRLRIPALFPIAVGENTTLKEQVAPGAREPPQLFVSRKPPVSIGVKVSVAVPMLLKVTVCVALLAFTATDPNASDCGENTPIAGAGAAPVPLRETAGIGAGASLATVSEPVPAPATVGVKLTLIVQLALGITVAGQLFV